MNEKLQPLQPEGQALVRNINIQCNRNLDANETGTHVATISVDLLKAEQRNAKLDTIKNMWRAKLQGLPDIINLTFKEPAIGPGGLPIEIRLQNNDLELLKQASLELQDWLNQYVGVFDLNDDLRPGKPEIRVRIKPGALAHGMDAASIANQLRASFYGQTADEFQVGSESYEIDVQLSTLDQNSLDDLDYFYVTTKTGERIPLKNVASLEYQRGIARISRVNSLRTLTIQGDVDTNLANAAEILADTKENFLPQLQQKYPDITFNLEGQEKESKETGEFHDQSLHCRHHRSFCVAQFPVQKLLGTVGRHVRHPTGAGGGDLGTLPHGIGCFHGEPDGPDFIDRCSDQRFHPSGHIYQAPIKKGRPTGRRRKNSQPPAFSGNPVNLVNHDYGTVATPDGKKPASPGIGPLGDQHRFRYAGFDCNGSSGRAGALFDFR